MMQKKGAIELSVTAIVVLILAVVMLGLGLGFVRGMFGKVSQSFEEQIGAEPEPVAATADDPLTLSRAKLIARPKENVVVKVNVLNTLGSDWSSAKPAVTCSGDAGPAVILTPTSVAKTTIKSGESGTFNVILKVKDTFAATEKGIQICKVNMQAGTPLADVTGGPEKEFTVEIR
ncbi:hypothetical protein HYU13_04750 [Candidatus Woesearchaeota archaeon]|nr:hypothetical protein [Candidatus Woesearchaeota archaeon]